MAGARGVGGRDSDAAGEGRREREEDAQGPLIGTVEDVDLRPGALLGADDDVGLTVAVISTSPGRSPSGLA